MAPAPTVELTALDQLWFQLAGTVCNLECKHCFASCSPLNRSYWFLERSQVQSALQDSIDLGVKEYHFTGGEPFLHREIIGILQDTLALGPATVLTNATLFTPQLIESLVTTAVGSAYSLEFSVGLDGATQESNDAIRGHGTFVRTMKGIEMLVAAGFLPILTAMQSWPDEDHESVLAGFAELLADYGYNRPRIRILPQFHIGAETARSRAYLTRERVTPEMLLDVDVGRLLCSRARLLTTKGVYACPILLGCDSARIGTSLAEATGRAVSLSQQACYTCYCHVVNSADLPVEARNVA